MTLRVSPSMMSSRRDLGAALVAQSLEEQDRILDPPARVGRPPRCTSCRAVGIWLGSPSHSSQRLSNSFTSCANGTLKCRPGCVIGVADRLAELGDDRLFRLGHGVEVDEIVASTMIASAPPISHDRGFTAPPSAGRLLRRAQREQRQDAPGLLVEDQLLAHARQHLRQRLQVEARARHVRRLAVCSSSAMKRCASPLARFTRSRRSPPPPGSSARPARAHAGSPGCIRPRLIDRALALLDRLVDVVERRLHRLGRVDVLQHQLLHGDAVVVAVGTAPRAAPWPWPRSPRGRR